MIKNFSIFKLLLLTHRHINILIYWHIVHSFRNIDRQSAAEHCACDAFYFVVMGAVDVAFARIVRNESTLRSLFVRMTAQFHQCIYHELKRIMVVVDKP